MPKHNRPSYVNNVVGTSKRKCKCRVGHKTWLSHWERGTGLARPMKCCAKYCRHYVEVGAHVRLFGEDQRIIWIIPFCQYHNKRRHNHSIELKPGVMLCGAAKIDCV
jgi:hypothetical protein